MWVWNGLDLMMFVPCSEIFILCSIMVEFNGFSIYKCLKPWGFIPPSLLMLKPCFLTPHHVYLLTKENTMRLGYFVLILGKVVPRPGPISLGH